MVSRETAPTGVGGRPWRGKYSSAALSENNQRRRRGGEENGGDEEGRTEQPWHMHTQLSEGLTLIRRDKRLPQDWLTTAPQNRTQDPQKNLCNDCLDELKSQNKYTSNTSTLTKFEWKNLMWSGRYNDITPFKGEVCHFFFFFFKVKVPIHLQVHNVIFGVC